MSETDETLFDYQNLRNCFKDNSLYIIKDKIDIFYSLDKNLPLLVVENTDKLLNSSKNLNTNVNNFITTNEMKKLWNYPFYYNNNNIELNEDDYKEILSNGGALKRNGYCKNNKFDDEYYLSTFNLTNISIIEIVLKTGLLYLLDFWIESLFKNNTLKNIKIFSGSISSKKDIEINGKKINIPSYYYKIITCEDSNFSHNNFKENDYNFEDSCFSDFENQDRDRFYTVCFLIPNIRPEERIYKLYKYIVNLSDIINLTGINFYDIFKFYTNYNDFKRINNLRNRIRIDLHLNDHPILIKKIKISFFYGLIVDSKTVEELENNWKICCSKGFCNKGLDYYYNLCKNKLIKLNVNNNKKNKTYNFSNNFNIFISNKEKTKKKPLQKKNSLKILKRPT